MTETMGGQSDLGDESRPLSGNSDITENSGSNTGSSETLDARRQRGAKPAPDTITQPSVHLIDDLQQESEDAQYARRLLDEVLPELGIRDGGRGNAELQEGVAELEATIETAVRECAELFPALSQEVRHMLGEAARADAQLGRREPEFAGASRAGRAIPLPRSGEELILAVRAIMRQAENNPAAAATFIRRQLLPHLRDLDGESTAAPLLRVRLADLAIWLAAEFPPSGALTDFASCVRGYLKQSESAIMAPSGEAKISRGERVGYFQTIATLAQLVGRTEKTRESRLQQAVYYNEFACFAFDDSAERGSGDSEESFREDGAALGIGGLDVCFNNLAAVIGSEIQDRATKGAAARPAGQEVVRSIVRCGLAVALSQTLQRHVSKGAFDFHAEVFGVSVDRGESSAITTVSQTLAAFDLIATVPLALGNPTGIGRAGALEESDQSMLIAYAGIARAALRVKDRAAAGMFNAAVHLLQSKRHSEPVVVMTRMLLNCIGAAFALSLSGDEAGEKIDLMEAMFENDGGDCIVNLFGAAVDSSQEVMNREALAVLRDQFSELCGRRGGRALQLRERMMASCSRLDLAKVRASEPGAEVILRALAEQLGTLSLAIGSSTPPIESASIESWLMPTMKLVDASYSSVGVKLELFRERVRAIIEGCISDARRPAEVIRKEYAKFVDVGPAVASGICDEAEWRGAVMASVSNDVNSISDCLSRAYSIQGGQGLGA